MDWDKLRIFHSVAEVGSFTHAGESLNLSQSAVSRQISTLEESLGVLLFHRHARGLLLTEQGEILHKAAREIFGKLAMIEGQLSDSKELQEGPLRLTVPEFIGSTWLAPRIHDLKHAHPNIQLTILLDDRVLNLGMREADAAIRLYEPDQPDLIQRHLTTLHFRIFASKSYIETYGEPKKITDLKKHTLLGYPESTPTPYIDTNWLFRLAGVDPSEHNNIIMMNSMLGIYNAVQSGAGIAALPKYLVKDNDAIVRLLPDHKGQDVEMFFVYPEERRHSGRIKAFREFLLGNINATKF